MGIESLAGNEECRRLTQERARLLARTTWYHSIELPDGAVVPGLIPIEQLRARIASFPIPADLSGKRVLDVGAATGWCSFEMERRGAEVVAVDCVEFEELRAARELLGSRVHYEILDVDELSAERLGVFDYVLFFGVLYHLRHPLLGLEKICALTREQAFIESFVIDGSRADDYVSGSPALMEFYETDELAGQIDNWVGPNTNCLLAMCRSAGFASARLEYVHDRRAGATCARRWDPAPREPREPAPRISSAVNNRSSLPEFHEGKDEYVCLYFKHPRQSLARDQLLVEIDGFGAPLLSMTAREADSFQANLRLPPGLAPGPHEISVRTIDSLNSAPARIILRARNEIVPEAAFSPSAECRQPAPDLFKLENSSDGSVTFHGWKDEYLCCYFRSSDSHLQREDVQVLIDGQGIAVAVVLPHRENEWQVNVRLSGTLGPGVHQVRVRTARSLESNSLEFHFEQSKE